ncbi:MAG: 30S ribosomal protein S13 [Candidatus Thermoplasmatota archaeon]|nr:30S ribosomal protein S13 [Candidatus Thermoplasmatota archaeon]
MQEEFKHIVRIAGVDIDGNKPLEHALQLVRGMGPTLACIVCDRLGVERTQKLGDLSDARIEELSDMVENAEKYFPSFLLNHRDESQTGKDFHIVGSDHIATQRDDVEFLKRIRCYRGIRHERGLKVRGQKTKNNGRRGIAVGVARQRARGGA